MGSNSKSSLLRLLSDLEPQIKKLSSPPSGFVRFKDLPPELRLMIWRHAFPPGRHFDIDSHWVERRRSRSAETSSQLPSTIRPTPEFPVTLFVNYESRHETLRHYHMISPQDCFGQMCKAKPFWINPRKDSLHFSFLSIQRYLFDFSIWLKFLDNRIPGGLRKFQGLEMSEVTWYDIEVQSSQGERRMSWVLSHFSGIRKLAFTLCVRENHDRATNFWFSSEQTLKLIPVGLNTWAPTPSGYTKDEALRHILGMRRLQEDKLNAPTITLRKWQPTVRYTESDPALRSNDETMAI